MNTIKSLILACGIMLTTASLAFSQSSTTAQQEATSKTATIAVKGVTCSSDLITISGNVKKLKGVTSCEVAKKGATSKFKIVFNPALVTEKQIHAAIEDTEGCENPNDRPYKVKL